jgi:hypothetical protein
MIRLLASNAPIGNADDEISNILRHRIRNGVVLFPFILSYNSVRIDSNDDAEVLLDDETEVIRKRRFEKDNERIETDDMQTNENANSEATNDKLHHTQEKASEGRKTSRRSIRRM